MNYLVTYFVSSILSVCALNFHPVHYSVTNIDLPKKSDTLHVTLKINAADLSLALSHLYNKPVSVAENSLANLDNFLMPYLKTRIRIKTNAEAQHDYILKDKKLEETDIWLFLKLPIKQPINEIIVMQAILFDVFMDQTNLIIFSDNSAEKGFQTTFDDREITIRLNN